MRIEHIGYAVRDIRKAIAEFTVLGFTGGEIVSDNARGVDICFMSGGGIKIELVAPAAKNSPVSGFLRKNGGAPYHLCYAAQDIEAEIAALVSQRFRLVQPPAKAEAFGGRRVAFLYGAQIGLIELVEDYHG